jgi:hypothetical protein
MINTHIHCMVVGKAGFNGEHSWADAPVLGHSWEYAMLTGKIDPDSTLRSSSLYLLGSALLIIYVCISARSSKGEHLSRGYDSRGRNVIVPGVTHIDKLNR